MAKKTKNRNKPVRGATSVSALRAERGIDALTPAFVRWIESSQELPAGGAMVVLEPIKAFVAAYFEAAPASDVTSFDPVPFGLTFAEVLGGLEDADDDVIEFIVESIHLYLEFLGETDSWTGTGPDFTEIDNLFHEDGGERAVPEIVVPGLTTAEELAGLSGTELARRLDALLNWIGNGRDVTSKGWLRMKDIEGAAAAIGVEVRGANLSGKKTQDALFGDIEPGDKAARTVKSMNDEPSLALFWTALQSAFLIELGSTRVRLTPLAETYRNAEGVKKLAVLRDFTTKFIGIAVNGEQIWNPWMVQAAAIETAVLVGATTDTPPAMDTIRALASPSGERFGDEFAGRIVLGRLEYLAELGLLTLDTHIQVPAAVVGSVAAALAKSLRFDDGAVFDLDRPDAEPAPAAKKRPKRKPQRNPEAPILQLKVMLKGSKPPIWRRLLVRSDLTLAQLHHVIQMSFEWQGDHLHNFRAGGWPGTLYGPADQDGFGDPPMDEAGVAVGELLAAERDSITYTYDFGDDWEHAVVVEKVLPYDAGAPAVRCTGGRGAGPAEDSGGVWGWAAMVEAVNDPSHEEHEDFRDWLGLRPGEKLDPKAFDWKGLNEELMQIH